MIMLDEYRYEITGPHHLTKRSSKLVEMQQSPIDSLTVHLHVLVTLN